MTNDEPTERGTQSLTASEHLAALDHPAYVALTMRGCLANDEIDTVVEALKDRDGLAAVREYLTTIAEGEIDTTEGDGSNTEASLAAILLGILELQPTPADP
jgi:hypothetical protein